jgi:hypothetical protein
LSESYRPLRFFGEEEATIEPGGRVMLGKLKWVALAAMIMGLTSGCRVCERWYEREHDPNCHPRPNYYPQNQGCGCPPGCAPVQPACPPGCAPSAGGYGTGFAPAYGGCNQ